MPTEEGLLLERHRRQEEERRERLESERRERRERRRLRVRLPTSDGVEEEERESSIRDPAERVRVINEIIEMTTLATGGAAGDSSAATGGGGGGGGGDSGGGSGAVGDPGGGSPRGGDEDGGEGDGEGAVAETALGEAPSRTDGPMRPAPIQTTPASVNRWMESARKRR